MAIKTKEQLKSEFKNGDVIREQNFVDLIDSTYNEIIENGEDGLSVAPAKDSNRFISFFKNLCNLTEESPLFSINNVPSTVNGRNQLSINAPIPEASSGNKSILHIVTQAVKSKKGSKLLSRVGVNTSNPRYDLEVKGALGARCTVGTFSDTSIDPKTVIANGDWHNLLTNQVGFLCFEITATVSDGKHHCILNGKALKAFDHCDIDVFVVPSRSIFEPKGQLKLRWREKNGVYSLQIRTHKGLQGNPQINYKITKILA